MTPAEIAALFTGNEPDLYDANGGRVAFEDDAEEDRYSKNYDWMYVLRLTSDARTVYGYIRCRAGSKGKSWPERCVIAKVLLMSERKIHDMLHELENNGLITIVDRRKEGKPSEYIINRRQTVMERQYVLQNLQDPKPLADSARGSCKRRKRVLQNLQFPYKETVDTAVDTAVDTNETGRASAPSAASAAPAPQPLPGDLDLDDLPEWDATMPVTSVTPAVSRPTLVPPQTTPTAEKKDRTPSLKESDPAIWARREAIKTRYFAEFTAETWESLSQRERAYRNEDAERLARLCADTDEALALMRAVYDEGWTDRATGKPVYRNRWLTTVSLLKILPKRLKDFRDGAIQTATPADPTAPRGTGYGKVRTSGLGRTDGFRYEPHPVITWCDHDSNGGGEGCRMAAGEEHDTPLCGRTGTVVLEKDANGEARRVS